MSRTLRRDIRLLQIYATVSSLVIVFLAVSAFRQAPNSQIRGDKVDELTVQRLNVVDANGTLRLVLSGKDRMHPGILDGKVIDRPRPVAGMIFFNDEGDEVGGLTMTGQRLSELIDKLNAAQTIPDPVERDKAVKAARSSVPPSPRRVFVGKNTDRSAAIMLADAAGKPRLNLRVDANGEALIEFLDADGKVTQRLPR